MQYLAILGDIRRSEQSPDRGQTQRKLIRIAEQINRSYANQLAANFVVSSGDAIQGLLANADSCCEILLDLELGLYPSEIRFGLGIGKVSTPINPSNSNEIDGQVYHLARRMLDQVKRNEASQERVLTNYLLAGADFESFQMENALFSLISVLKKRWTERQMEVIKAHLSTGMNRNETVRQLGVDPSTVSRSLMASHFFSYLSAAQALNQAIERRRRSDAGQ